MFKANKKKSIWRKLSDFIYPKIGVKRSIKYTGHRLGRMKSSPYEIACGFAIGAAISFTPFMGLHIIISAIIAFIMRGSIIASAIGTVVGNPLTFPFIWALVYSTGAFIVGATDEGVNITEQLFTALEKFGEINSWHLLFITDYSLAVDMFDEYKTMWGELFSVIYVFIIGSIPWIIIVWIIFFAIIYPLVKKYKDSKKKK